MVSHCLLKICACMILTAVLFRILYMVFPDFETFHLIRVNYILSIFLVISTYCLSKRYFCGGEIQPSNKAVLITGCDSGFGNHLAKRLDSKGFHVFASCLFPEGAGANDLKQTCSNRLQVLPLDVTRDESVANAFNFVKENLGSNVLWAVVNNAGISKGFSTDFSTIQHFKDTLDVNALGPVRVTKAFLPLLKKSKGRVVNVASLAGRVAAMDLCPYAMSKHAAVAFTECLNLEMDDWGVRAISIEPEGFRTPITNSGNLLRRFDDELKEIDEDVVSSYGDEYLKGVKRHLITVANVCCSNVGIVVDAMESAITKKNPDHVYKPSRNWLVLVLICLVESIIPSGLYVIAYSIMRKITGYPVRKDKSLNH